MKYKYILGIDPSGNFNEGKGTTGLCFLNAETLSIKETKSISAKNFETWEAYVTEIMQYIQNTVAKYSPIALVIEDYLLYATKACSQINSKMETPKLIGVIEYYCKTHGICVVLQPAHLVKNRWTNSILEYKRFIKIKNNRTYTQRNVPIDRHAIDAIRHAVHYAYFKNKGAINQHGN